MSEAKKEVLDIHTLTHARTHTRTHMHARTRTHTHARTHTCTRTLLSLSLYLSLSLSISRTRTLLSLSLYLTHTHRHARTHACTHRHTRTHACMHAHTQIHAHYTSICIWLIVCRGTPGGLLSLKILTHTACTQHRPTNHTHNPHTYTLIQCHYHLKGVTVRALYTHTNVGYHLLSLTLTQEYKMAAEMAHKKALAEYEQRAGAGRAEEGPAD